MPELVDGKNCLLSCNEQQMLKNIDKVINSKELRKEIGANARSTYEKKYAPKIILKKFLNLL